MVLSLLFDTIDRLRGLFHSCFTLLVKVVCCCLRSDGLKLVRMISCEVGWGERELAYQIPTVES